MDQSIRLEVILDQGKVAIFILVNRLVSNELHLARSEGLLARVLRRVWVELGRLEIPQTGLVFEGGIPGVDRVVDAERRRS